MRSSTDASPIYDDLEGFWRSAILGAGIRLKIFDHIAGLYIFETPTKLGNR